MYVLAWFNLFAGVLELLDLPQEALQLAQHLRLGAMSLHITVMLSGGLVLRARHGGVLVYVLLRFDIGEAC